MVVGDLNDTPNAEPIRGLIGRRVPRLVDLRPLEGKGDHLLHPKISFRILSRAKFQIEIETLYYRINKDHQSRCATCPKKPR